MPSSAKTQYTETEAADQLGLSVESLRKLIREQILADEDVERQSVGVAFQPADLLMLKLLVSRSEGSQD